MFRSITVKFFLMILTALVILTGSLLFFQSYFFENYYISQKSKIIKERTAELVSIYKEAENPFSFKANQDVARYSESYGLEITFIEEPTPVPGKPQSGTIISLTTGRSDTGTLPDLDFYTQQLQNSHDLYEKNKPEMDSGKTLSYSKKNSFGITYIITLSRLKTGDGTHGLLVVFSSLQPVDEAVGVIRDYYLIFLGVGLITSLVLAFLISRQITRPLIHINTVASSISRLDFSQQCMVNSKDELEDLSKTVNRLSDNLNGAISELKDTNIKLVVEIERQKEQEAIRKRFVAGVSHELKTPLSVIKGYTEGLVDAACRGEVKQEYANIIQEEVDHMGQIVTDMLDLSQLEAGKYTLNLETVTINRLLNYEIRRIMPSVEKKKITFLQNLPDQPVTVTADGRRIAQVMSNLLNNAVRYTPPEGSITVGMVKASDVVRVEVENACVDVPEEELARIWDDFYRVDPSHNRESGGSGLGLAVVKSILELHGSNFGAVKTQTGLKFFFDLPPAD